MAPDDRSSIPSTPVSVSLTVVGLTIALPLALVGLSAVTGVDAGPGNVFQDYQVFLAVMAAVSLLAVPYGVALGLATVPVAVRTGIGYGTGTRTSMGRRLLDHVAGAVLYAGLTTFAAGLALWTSVRLAGPVTLLESLGTGLGPASLLGGGLLVAGTFLGGRLHRRHDRDPGRDGRRVGICSLYAAALLPSPFVALILLEWLLLPGDLPGVGLPAPW